MKALSLVFLATIFATCYGVSYDPTPLLLPSSGGRIDCLSWRVNVEINNFRNWDLVPKQCAAFVEHYMLRGQYAKECEYAALAAYEYAKNLTLKGDGKNLWIFDIDDTVLSTLPFQHDNGFGSNVFNDTRYKEWEAEGTAPKIPEMSELYHKLVSQGFKIVFITGRSESIRATTEQNMKNEGFHTWEKLILKTTADKGLTKQVYKSRRRTELVAAGYRILGNMGDQWSDLLGDNPGSRTFKLPNPMYYTP